VENNSFSQKESVSSNNYQDQVKSSQGKSVLETEKDINNKSEKGEQAEKQTEIETPGELTEERITDLKKKAEERDSILEQLLRNKAEFSDYQKRMIKENESAAQLAVRDLLLDLLPELDNFDRAFKQANDSKDIAKFVEGIKLTESQLFKVLGKYGVKAIKTIGKAFDPNLHDAVMGEENNEMPHHTIITEFQKGFLLKEHIVRPAKVKVSKRIVEERRESKGGEAVHIKPSFDGYAFHKKRKGKVMRRNTKIGILLGVIIIIIIGTFLGTRTNVNEQKISDLVLPEGVEQQHEIEEIKWERLQEEKHKNSQFSEEPLIAEELQFTEEPGKTDESQIAEEIPYEDEEKSFLEDKQQISSVNIYTKTIYKVKPNDSLSKIAKKYFGDETKWGKIFEANKDNMSGPHSLYVGQELLIPDVSVEKPETQASRAVPHKNS
jgi:molecular chaperone GrpE